MKTKALGLMVFLLLFGSQSWTQEKTQDRRKFLDPKTPVSDDPRRTVVKPGPRGPEGTLVLRNGRVFDGTGAPAREGTLVIERNKVVGILPPGSTDWPKDAQVIDVSGKTILPGLIDLHTHLTYPLNAEDFGVAMNDADATLRAVEKLRYFIESGITSVRDVGSKGDIPFRLKVWVAENRVAGPRVFPAGAFITSEGGHSTENTPDELIGLMGATRLASGPDDWRQAVREQFHKGADVIKLGSHFSAEEVKAAVTEAHELGLKVTVDAETFYIQRAVEAGADTIEHPLPRSEETIQLMAKKGVAADPTLIPYQIIFDEWGGYFGSTRDQMRNRHGLDFALVPLHAGAVHPGGDELCGSRMEGSGGVGGGDEDERGDSGYGRPSGYSAAGEVGRRAGGRRQAGREFGRPS